MFLFFDFSFHPTIELALPNAYLAEKQNGYASFYKKATTEVLHSLTNFELSESEKRALSIVNSLQPNILHQKYIKKGDSFEEIYKNAQIKKHIQQQIEEKTAELLSIIAENSLFITTNHNHKDDISKKILPISTNIIEPLLEFTKIEGGISYRLLLQKDDEKLLPCESHIELLNNSYAWIVLKGQVVRVAHIKASHLKPFLNKENTFIPEKTFPEYFEKFLKKVLRNAQVEAKGFKIITQNELKSSELDILYDFFANHYKIYIHFDYNGYTFDSNQAKSNQSNLEISPNNDIKIYNYQRNKEEETRKYRLLEQLGFVNDGGTFSVESKDPFASYFHLLHCKKDLEEAGFGFHTFSIEGGKEISEHLPELIFAETSTENDWFDLNIRVKQGENSFHFKDLIKNLKENNPIYLLPDGKAFIIPQEWFSKFGSIAKYAQIRQEKLQISKSNYALLEAVPEIKPQNLVEKVSYTSSPNLRATLRPYQIEGVEWLLQHYYNGVGACLADDMGLGKTLQTIALLVAIHDALPEKAIETADLFSGIEKSKEALKVLVILPSSLIFNWYDETKRFAPHFKCTQYVGADRKVKAKRLGNYDVVFTSYPIVERDVELFQKYEFRYIILDESQRIKNKNSKTFKAIHTLKATHRIALSGTPIENSLSDLWSQMQFINPNILKSYTSFYKNYEVEISKKKNTQALEELKTIISPFLLRRTKEQVLDDLPEMEEQIIYCPMSEAQHKWYETEKSKVRNQLLQINEPITEFNTLNMLMRLRKISLHPKLVDKESKITSGKYEEVINYMEELLQSSRKALIFSSFVSHLALYEEWCNKKGIKYAKLTGETPSFERKNQVEMFQNNPSISFFFISLKAGEVGLNLTQASYVLLLDPWWNPFSEKQAIGRAHRIGQQNKVNVIRFVSKDTIEEKIIKLQKSKRELSENIIDENHIIKEVMEQIDSLLE